MHNVTTSSDNSDENNFHNTLNMLRSRNFRLLWLGEGVSVMGDQFTLIALPWLILQLTGDSMAVGSVLALAGIPRAVFMLLGGALTDRISPRTTMILSNLFRLLFVGGMAAVILTNSISLWMAYVFALLFGLADAFYYPAVGTIVTNVVEEKDLQTGNAIVQGTARLSVFIGPMLAGGLITLLGNQGTSAVEGTPSLSGIGAAFLIDALTFGLSLITLWQMRIPKASADAAEMGEKTNVLTSIKEGIVYTYRDQALRVFFFVAIGIHLFATGPIFVGIPVLADIRFTEGAAAMGLIMSAFGGGNFLGIVIAGAHSRPKGSRLGRVLTTLGVFLGIGLGLIGFTSTVYVTAAIALLMGGIEGYILIVFTSWLQARTPQNLIGRMISLLTLCSVGLVPISNALSGWVIKLSDTGLYLGAGIGMIIVALIAKHNPIIQTMDEGVNHDALRTRTNIWKH